MTVYADEVFAVNFLYNAGILCMMLRLSSKRISVLRLILSATVGGVQSLLFFIPYFRILCMPPFGFAMAYVMAFIAMCGCNRKEAVRGGTLLLTCAFVFSGTIAFFRCPPIYGIALLLPAYVILEMIKRTALKKYKTAMLVYGEHRVRADGFCDSGNLMEYNGCPVLLANEEVFKSLLGKNFSIYAAEEWVNKEDLRLIPYTALGKSGAIIGIKLDKAVVSGICYDGAILGYSDSKLGEKLILNGIMT